MSGWAARQLQLVWFSPASVGLSAYELYRAVSGLTPTSTNTGVMSPFQMQFGGHMMPGPFENANGQFENAAWSVSVQQQRVDVILAPIAQTINQGRAPLLDNVEQRISQLDRARETLGVLIRNVNRVAFVGNYVEEQVDIHQASTNILDRLGIVDGENGNAEDVSFSINRKKSISGFTCNRMMRWQVETFSNMTLTIGPDGNVLPVTSNPVFAAGVTVDVNTVPMANFLIEDAAQADLFTEVIAEGTRLWMSNRLAALTESSDAKPG